MIQARRILTIALFQLMAVAIVAAQPAAPARRSGFGMAYDVARRKLVVFGGSDSAFQRLGDTWEWDGAWHLLATTGPTPRADFAMAYDAARGMTVLFGGRSSGGLSSETWTWNGERWTRADSGAGPSARNLVTMTYDRHRERVVLFGGSVTGKPVADTWEWDGARWANRTPGVTPPARGAHALSFDAVRDRVLLVGGSADESLSDTWEWDGATWTATGAGPDVLHTSAATDSVGNTYLFGGFVNDGRGAQLWTRSGATWTERTFSDGPPARAEHRATFIPGTGFVIFGGIGGQGMSVEERGRAKLNDLWAFDGARWRRLEPR